MGVARASGMGIRVSLEMPVGVAPYISVVDHHSRHEHEHDTTRGESGSKNEPDDHQLIFGGIKWGLSPQYLTRHHAGNAHKTYDVIGIARMSAAT